jgi:hypothetical protein
MKKQEAIVSKVWTAVPYLKEKLPPYTLLPSWPFWGMIV